MHQLSRTCDCKLACNYCSACVHMYTCTCMDSTLHATVCKHVHSVHMKAATHTYKPSPTENEKTFSLDYFSGVLKQDTPCDITSLKQKARCKIVDLEALVNSSDDVKCLKTITQHIQAAITVGTAIRGMRKTLPEKRTYPPNTNSQKQRRFYSTKKRKMTLSTTLSKPSYEQSDICKSRLRSMEPFFCVSIINSGLGTMFPLPNVGSSYMCKFYVSRFREIFM